RHGVRQRDPQPWPRPRVAGRPRGRRAVLAPTAGRRAHHGPAGVVAPAATGADWLCAALAEQGVPVLFGNPGSTELPLTEALGRQDRLRYVLGLHEAAVMGMADGYAQATGRLAAVNVHVQPGLANALAGILNAARA